MSLGTRIKVLLATKAALLARIARLEQALKFQALGHNLDQMNRLDTARLDWIEANLCREGEVVRDGGHTRERAKVWVITTQADDGLRATVDLLRAGGAGHA